MCDKKHTENIKNSRTRELAQSKDDIYGMGRIVWPISY